MHYQKTIKYKDGYKYQMDEEYRIWVNIIQPKSIVVDDFIFLSPSGDLRTAKGYAWDGASGPVIDRPNNMRASLVHDALYQLLRSGQLSQKHRRDADKVFRRICIEDGVPKWLANMYDWGLKGWGVKAADPLNAKKQHSAP